MKETVKKPSILLEIRLPDIDSTADSQSAYDSIYTETDISQRESFYLWLNDLFNFRENEAYLDISCGRAQLVNLAKPQKVKAFGLDLSFAALQSGLEGDGKDMLITGNSQLLPFASNSFDIVTNIGSLEHYVDMETAVSEMTRVLRPGGRAIVLVPNTFSLLTNILIAYRQGKTSIDLQPIQRYAARQEWQDIIEGSGLVVKQTHKYEREWPRTAADRKYYLAHPKEMIRLLLTPIIPLNLAFCFVFEAYKPEQPA
ncbi:MAG: class I SAM-dependent methyltransferase [Chloroflexota bacterium]